ncbi:MAG: OmpH family outer membrane protein [Opitutaceae bacterium]|jgi:outer membrane protein
MKKSIASLLALAASLVLALTLRAQPEPKILIVDIGKVFENHYEKQEKEAELRSDEQKAEGEMQRLVKEGNDLVDQYKDLLDQSKNPALTPEARAKADDDSKKKMDEIKSKQNELDTFKQNIQHQLQQRIQGIRNILIDSISKTAADVAKRHGATLLLDKSGVSIFGADFLVYSDPAYDITDEVIKEVNKDRPAPAPGSPAAVPSSDTSAPPPVGSSVAPVNGAPKITTGISNP